MSELTCSTGDLVSLGNTVTDPEEGAMSDILDPSIRNIDQLRDDACECFALIKDCCDQKDIKNRRVVSQTVAKDIVKYVKEMLECVQKLCKIAVEEFNRADYLDRLQQVSNSFLDTLEEFKKPSPSITANDLQTLEDNIVGRVQNLLKEGRSYADIVSRGRAVGSGKVKFDQQMQNRGDELGGMRDVMYKEIARRSTVVVKPLKSSNFTKPSEIKDTLAKSLDCSGIGVHIQKVNQTRKSNLLVKVKNEEEAKIFIDTVSQHKDLHNLVSADIP